MAGTAPVLPLERSTQLLDILKGTISRDLDGGSSVIRFFLTHEMSGGWESWLQVSFAHRAVTELGLADFAREVTYPGTQQRCDVWFQDTRGVPIWVEMKTQRNRTYRGTVRDFVADVTKLDSLTRAFKEENVLAATALLVLHAEDRGSLNSFRSTGRPPGQLWYLKFTGRGVWEDVTATILTTEPGSLIYASFVPNVRPPSPPTATRERVSR